MDSRSRPRRAGRATVLALCCLAALSPATAHAAFAPKLSIAIEPATPKSPITVSSTVRQSAGEEASRRVRLSFPAGFGFDLDVLRVLPACSEQQYAAGGCPANSRIGAVDADAGFPVGIVKGGVFWGGAVAGKPTLYAFLSNDLTRLLGMDQKLRGTSEFRGDGGIDTVFDNLPNVATTRLTFAIDGGAKPIVLSPATCGAFAFKGAFTSQSGATATSEAAVTIAGCTPRPTRSPPKPRPRLSPIVLAKVISTRSGATARSRANLKGALTVRLRRAATRRLLATRRVRVAAPGPIKVSRVGRGLAAGRYVLELSLRANGRTAKRTRAFRVR